ncbi:hypothetical protein JCM17846_09260 [Iodidimonas nitroreducens]|uniref:YjbH domain-containing protein n=1 Tax=Iodidimonas nitroreducens TaxID=1236968 RepID=A0A5A7N6A2_9PROT|nr:YjbH domain-containing protein [Iodidimonas nitroreducens]GER03244.1 hypothetical protein JCM17846_09260 [Iodidimonas nitroreducens]
MVFSLKAMGAVVLFGLFMAGGESQGQNLSGFDEPQPSTTAFGTTGLLQSPSARFSKPGTVELGGFFVEPYRGFTIRAQPLPWLEANFRVTDITNIAKNGTVLPLGQISFLEDLFSLKGGGTRRQRGFDLKIRLLQEGDFLPAVAVGGQDLFGDADFGGEYLVASKRFGPVDITFGLGWGYFGSRGHIGNPLDSLDDGFRRRSSGDVRGSFNFGDYFSGNDLAFFGGVEWHTPLDGFSVKLDYSGADPERAPLGSRLDEDFPVNMGVNYRPVHWLDMALGFERGNTLSARMAVRFDLFDLPRFYPRDGRQGGHPAAGAPFPKPSGDGATVAPKPAAPHRMTNDLVLELSAFLRRAGHDTARISVDANAVYVAITSPMAGLGPFDEQALATAIFEAIPLVIDQLWLSFGPEKPSDSRLYQRDEDHGRAAGAMLALVDGLYGADEGYAATIRLADGVALYDLWGAVNGDMAFASALADPLLLTLPDDLYLIKMRSFADGFVERDLAAPKALASARAMMMATADAPVSSLRIEGRTRATVQIDAADGSRIDGALLSQRLDVAESLVMASGYDNQTALEAFAADFFARMARAGIRPRSVAWLDGRMTIWIDGGPSDFEIQRIGRIARDLALHGTDQLEAISIRRGVGRHDAIDVQLLRRDVVRAVAGRGSAEEIWLTSAIEMEPAPLPDKTLRVENDKASPFLEWGVAPVLIQHIGDQESGPWLADLSIDLLASLDLAPGLQLSGAVRRFIAGNLDQISPASSSSDLPWCAAM